MNMVSILIPVYNRHNFIGDCIQSALNQTFASFEIVIVDNASTDGTWDICKDYARRDTRIRIFRNQENIGPVRNWMRCAEEARGEYSKILFSDDLLEPTCLEEMIAPLKSQDVGFVFCAANIGQSTDQSIVNYSAHSDLLLKSSDYVSLMINGKAPVSPGAVLLRTVDLLKNLHVNFPTCAKRLYASNGAGPDVMIMLLTAEEYPKIAWICKTLVFFRAHLGSFSIENKESKVTDGYTSVISWYLINNKKRFTWIQYLTRVWLSNLGKMIVINPIHLLKENEGDGRLSDLVCMMVAIPSVLWSRLIIRLNLFLYYKLSSQTL
jgi:glycosyltransferase involved in cell wall biosynthesis